MKTAHEDKGKAPAERSALELAEEEFEVARQHVADVRAEEGRRAFSYLPPGSGGVIFSAGSLAWQRINAAEMELEAARQRRDALLAEDDRRGREEARQREDAERAARLAEWKRRHLAG